MGAQGSLLLSLQLGGLALWLLFCESANLYLRGLEESESSLCHLAILSLVPVSSPEAMSWLLLGSPAPSAPVVEGSSRSSQAPGVEGVIIFFEFL